MKALVHLGFGEKMPDCTKCQTEPALREQYGCDRPASAPVFKVSCGCGDGCERCERGAIAMYRCPGKLVERRADIREAYWYCRQYEEHGLLPAQGGLGDQAPGWVALLSTYMSERRHVADIPRQKEELKQKRIQEIQMMRATRKIGG